MRTRSAPWGEHAGGVARGGGGFVLALARRRSTDAPRADEGFLRATIRLNIRGKDGKVKITKTVRLKDLEGTWTDVDVAAGARGG